MLVLCLDGEPSPQHQHCIYDAKRRGHRRRDPDGRRRALLLALDWKAGRWSPKVLRLSSSIDSTRQARLRSDLNIQLELLVFAGRQRTGNCVLNRDEAAVDNPLLVTMHDDLVKARSAYGYDQIEAVQCGVDTFEDDRHLLPIHTFDVNWPSDHLQRSLRSRWVGGEHHGTCRLLGSDRANC